LEGKEEYRRKNVRLAAIYFVLLVVVQGLGIYMLILFKQQISPLAFFAIGVFVATIWPILLAIVVFGIRW